MKWMVTIVGAALFALASCASSSATSGGSVPSSSAQTPSTTTPNLVSYNWRLAHVTTDNLSFDVHPLNPSDPPRIQFTTGGQYGASDGINYMSGSIKLTKSGFDAHFGTATLAGYAGTDRDVTAVVEGIGALLGQVPVTVTAASTPNTITMTVKGYELTFRRDGVATHAPYPSPTGPVPPVVYGTAPNCDRSTAPGNLPCPSDSIGPS